MIFALVHLWADLLGTGLYSSSAACHHMKTQGANNHRLLFNVVLLLVFTVSLCNCVSFYGLSYIRLPLQETKNSTDLEFRFKTHQLNAFLFLAAGTSDYFLVFLENGQLAVKINFGSGETYLASDGLQLNDLSWHKVKLKLVKSHLSLTVDDRHNFLQRLKGDSYELHIKYGIFLGGQDNQFKSLYLGNIRPLRGCIERVNFNFKDLLHESSLGSAILHNVSPECDEQFTESTSAARNESISFIDDDSFVLLPSLSSSFAKNHSKLSISLEVRSLSLNAVLFFSPSVSPYKRRYIALELINGTIRFAINDGTREVSLQSSVIVKEGQWQLVEAVANNDGQLMISVNGKSSRSNETIGRQGSWSFSSQKYSSELLLGGLSSRTDWSGLQSVMLSQNVSLKGCLKNVHIYGRSVSLLDALATHHVKSGKCKWHFLCSEGSADHSKSPCLETAQCLQKSINQVRCVCPFDNCIRRHFKSHKSILVSSEKSMSFSEQCRITLKHLRVLEGSSAAINYQVFASDKLKSPPDDTVFEVIQQPKFGLLEGLTESSLEREKTFFTWFDVLRGDLLLYRHNGHSLEHTSDLIKIRMKPISSTAIPPTASKGGDKHCEKIVFILPVDIIFSANDDPSKQNRNSVVHMKIAQNSKKLLPYSQMKLNYREFIKNKIDDTVEFIVGQIQGGGASYFERVSRPNVPIKDFTENEVKNQAIRFVHVDGGSANSSVIEATLHVHSGKVEVSQFVFLISTFATELLQVANTGLVMAHNTFALLNPANLSFSLGGSSTNEEGIVEQSQLIKYEILSGPKYGVVQKLRGSSNQWTNASHFSQRQVYRSKVRYVHLLDRPKSDQMELSISLNKLQQSASSQKITLVVNFVDQLKIVSSGPNRLTLNGAVKEVLIDSSKLSYRTEPVSSSAEIRLTLLSVPQCGGLYLIGDSANEKQMPLHVSSSFSQKDVNEGKVLLIRNNARKCADLSVDLFDFEVAIVGSNATQVATFFFDIGQSNRKKDELTNSKLNVNEGENATIEANQLYYSNENEEDIVIRVTRPPKHGWLKVLSADFSSVNHASPSQIAQKYIKQGRLLYVHDDSESDSDTFEFVVGNSTNQSLAGGTFFVEVTLKNDNSPVRLIDKPFTVIRGGEKPLLGSDIRYVDADTNTSSSSIVYTKAHIPNGHLFFLNGSSAENGFTQADLDKGSIRFRHNGSDIGKAILWVTDGQFYLSGVVEIRASEPYLRVVNNTGIVIKYGLNGLITTSNLAIDTNIDLSNKSSILFRITAEPKFGQLLVNEKMANQFTLEELEDEMVQFESTIFEDEEPSSKRDNFSFKVISTVALPESSGLVSDTYEFGIRIYPPSYYNLELVHHNNLTVLEEKSALLSSKTLLTKHSELGPELIVYRVVKRPANGHLVNSRYANLEDMAKRDGQSFSFTQEDINNGRLSYVQSIKVDLDPYNRYWDSFIFDVGNEIIRSGNKTLYIEVITKLITIQTNNISVSEGQASILSGNNLFVTHPYYERLVDQFIVIEEPKYGSISYESPSGMPLVAKSFTPEQLKEGKIAYRQDSSEVTNDWLTIVGRSNSLDKESLPATMHISISSVNDEAPKVVNNSIAWVWQGGTVPLDNAHLAATDQDNTASEITFTTYLSTNGYLIDGDSNTTVDTFTQEQINAKKIVFVHVGTADGSFRFHVTDGENSGVTSVFKVGVKQRKLLLQSNEKLIVSPGAVQSITRRHLQATSNDNDTNRTFTYRVVKAPSYGRLLHEGQQGFKNGQSNSVEAGRAVVSTFSQTDIDENQILYEQNVRITEPVVGDRVIFNIESNGLETLENVHFLVEIAVQSLKAAIEGVGNASEVVSTSPLHVIEGQFGAIGPAVINISDRLVEQSNANNKLCLLLLSTPEHGLVLRSGVTVMTGRECIPLEASMNGSLVYMHDHSNTLNDCIHFRLMLVDSGIQLLNITVPVKIKPVNDEFPVVINRNPTIKAIYGSKTLLTNATLRARDDDGPSYDLHYQIRRDGNVSRESFFVLLRTDTTIIPYREDLPVYEFRQSDVDSGRLYFAHRGKDLHLQYWFRVKDDAEVWCEDDEPPVVHTLNNFETIVRGGAKGHCTPYYPLKITVAQLSLQLLNHSAIQLPQGAFQVTITSEHLATASKNASPNFIRYKVTKGPFHGYISIDGTDQQIGSSNGLPVEFTQQMVDSGQVQYHVMNMSSEDYFIVDITQPDSNVLYYEKPIYDVNVKIVTVPLVKAIKPFLVTSPGQEVLLSYEYVDASSLAQHTRSNPLFKVLSPPRYGFFKLLPLLHFGESEAASPVEGIKEFTHKEIMDNRIAYVAQARLDLSYPNDMLIDVIHYELSASNVQSAHGILVVNVFHHNRSFVDLETLVSTSENVLQKINAGLSNQVLLIIGTILVSLLLVITLVLITRLCPFRREQRTGMPEQSSTKSLSAASDNLERCGRQYSSTSLRQTDCSSRTSSSNSALAVMATSASTGQLNNLSTNHHTQMRYADLLPPNQFAYKQQTYKHKPGSHRALLTMESLDAFISPSASNDLQQKQMRQSHGPQSDKSEDISPLPPPSLYFINDSSFDDHAQMWTKNANFKFEMQTAGGGGHTREQQQANRSSGDGTSHSESPHHSVATMKPGTTGKPYEQFVHLDNYLAREQAFYTLNSNKRASKASKPPYTQKSQYWI